MLILSTIHCSLFTSECAITFGVIEITLGLFEITLGLSGILRGSFSNPFAKLQHAAMALSVSVRFCHLNAEFVS